MYKGSFDIKKYSNQMKNSVDHFNSRTEMKREFVNRKIRSYL